MTAGTIKIIGISGSLRPTSSASAVLKVVAGLVPAQVEFIIYTGLEEIPPFNDNREHPFAVTNFINMITESDGVFFCTPEYAFGVPGVLKNALDWAVSSTAFSNKPVALITAASSGDKAHASLLLTLTALGTKKSDATALLISFIRNKMNEKDEIKDMDTLVAIQQLVAAFIRVIESGRAELINEDIS